MDEIWKDVDGFEGLYKISSDGKVMSLPKEWMSGNTAIRRHEGKLLIPFLNKRNGYLIVQLYKNSIRYRVKIHRLVAEAFIPKIDTNRNLVNHINGNKQDNRVENLEWVNHLENSCRNPNTPTTPEKPVIQMTLNENFIAEYDSISEAARVTKLNQGNISHCLVGRYRHTGGYKWKYKI